MQSSNNKSKTDATSEESDILPDDLLEDIAQLKGCAVPQKPVPVTDSFLYPVTAALKKAEEEEALRNPKPGQEIPGHGVIIGTWQLKGLSQKFNVFAAIEDLTNEAGEKEIYTYDDTVKRMAELEDWHGFDGTKYKNDKEFYEALKNGSYDGGWIIPPRELLTGTKANGPEGFRSGSYIVQPDNLFDHQDKGSLSGTFDKAAVGERVSGNTYFSSTMHWNGWQVWLSSLHGTGFEQPTSKNWTRASCRPVRLEPVP